MAYVSPEEIEQAKQMDLLTYRRPLLHLRLPHRKLCQPVG